MRRKRQKNRWLKMKGKQKSKEYMKVAFSVACLFLVDLFQSVLVYASDITQIGKYDLDFFGFRMVESSFWQKVKSFGMSEEFLDAIASLINLQMGIARVLWQGIDWVLEKILNLDLFNTVFDAFFRFGQKLFTNLYNGFGIAFLIVGVAFWGIYYLVGKREQAKRGFFRLLLSFFLMMLIFGFNGSTSQGQKIVKQVDQWFGQVEQTIFLLANETKEFGLAGESQLQNKDSLTKNVRKMFYEQAVVQPYLLMNYGTTDIQALEKAGIDPAEFLAEKMSRENIEKINDKVNDAYKEVEKDGKEEGEKAKYYMYLGQDKLVYKEAVAMFAPLMVIAIGVPLLFVVFGYLILNIAMLVGILVVIFSSFLALVPYGEAMFFNSLKRFLGFLFQKNMLSFLFLLIYYVGGLLDTFIPSVTIFQFVINALAKIVTFCVLFMKRKTILQKMQITGVYETLESGKRVGQNISQTAGQIYRAPSEMKKNLAQKTEKVQNGMLKGAEIAGNVYRPLKHGVNAIKMARTVQTRKGTSSGRVINPIEIVGRTPQSIGYSGRNVVYGQMEDESKRSANVYSVTAISMLDEQGDALFGLSSVLPVDRFFSPMRNFSSEKNMRIKKPSQDYIGQRVPLKGNVPIPQFNASQSLVKQAERLRELRVYAMRTLWNTSVYTSDSKYSSLEKEEKEKKKEIIDKSSKGKQLKKWERVSPKKASVPPLPNERTSQKRV